jgi:YegS/Rv2252/BmrU family lipid kinase
MPRAVVLLNARSRAGARPPLGRILGAFAAAGWQVEARAGASSIWTTGAARAAVQDGVDAVFGGGGDGVLAAILPALIGTRTALGVIPLGTGNVWARELGLPLLPEPAIAAQLSTPPRPVDLGQANRERPFLVAASAGFDASIVQAVETSGKGLGQLAYPLAGLGLASAARGTRCRVTLDDEPAADLSLLAAIVMNGRLYGGLVPLAPDARVDDGQLDVALFIGRAALDLAAQTAAVLAGQHLGHPNIVLRRIRRIRIESLEQPLPTQCDGDPFGTTPLSIEVVPGALLALGVPPAPVV